MCVYVWRLSYVNYLCFKHFFSRNKKKSPNQVATSIAPSTSKNISLLTKSSYMPPNALPHCSAAAKKVNAEDYCCFLKIDSHTTPI